MKKMVLIILLVVLQHSATAGLEECIFKVFTGHGRFVESICRVGYGNKGALALVDGVYESSVRGEERGQAILSLVGVAKTLKSKISSMDGETLGKIGRLIGEATSISRNISRESMSRIVSTAVEEGKIELFTEIFSEAGKTFNEHPYLNGTNAVELAMYGIKDVDAKKYTHWLLKEIPELKLESLVGFNFPDGAVANMARMKVNFTRLGSLGNGAMSVQQFEEAAHTLVDAWLFANRLLKRNDPGKSYRVKKAIKQAADTVIEERNKIQVVVVTRTDQDRLSAINRLIALVREQIGPLTKKE